MNSALQLKRSDYMDAEMSCNESLKRLLEALQNPHDLGLFLEAEQNLLKIGEPAVKMLIEILRDNDKSLLIRTRAGWILRKIGWPAKEPLLILMNELKDKDPITLTLAANVFVGIPQTNKGQG